MKKQNDLSLQDAMKSMLREYRLEPQMTESRIRTMWEEKMGKTIATYTSSISVRKGVLYLTILSAPLRHELSFSRDKIRSIINDELGQEYIKDVVIR
jgi:hypothetical protein